MLLEGPHLVREAVRLGLPLEIVLATPGFLAGDAGRELGARLAPAPLEVDPPLLRELSDVDAPQGLLAVASLPRGGVEALPLRPGGVYLYAEGIQDPGNLGALARSVEAAAGAALAIAPGSAHPNHPRALRASAGSLLRLALAREVGIAGLRGHLESLGPSWIALAARSGRSLWELDRELAPGRTLVLAVGSEGRGLEPATLAACDLDVEIPIEPAVESLNATVAAAVALFEIRRRRSGS